MATYIFIVALLNLGLGYLLAVVLMGERSSPASDVVPPRLTTAVCAMPVAEQPSAPATASPAERAAAESSVDEVKQELERYRGELAGLDLRMRECAQAPDSETLQECLRDLKVANTQYVEQQQQAVERVQNQPESRFASLHNQLSAAIEAQTTEIANVNVTLDGISLEGDLMAGCQTLLDQSARLTDVNDNLEDRLSQARRELDQLERAPRGSAPAEADAEISPEEARICAELREELTGWWDRHRDISRPLTIGLVDIDAFNTVNETFGSIVGDLVLKSVNELVVASVRGDDKLVLASGQRFLILFQDSPARDATSAVERLRQLVAATQFQDGASTIEITMSCAVTEAIPTDTQETVLSRGEVTLHEAKRHGRNRTFLHEGTHPTSVVPPNFAIEKRVVAIAS